LKKKNKIRNKLRRIGLIYILVKLAKLKIKNKKKLKNKKNKKIKKKKNKTRGNIIFFFFVFS